MFDTLKIAEPGLGLTALESLANDPWASQKLREQAAALLLLVFTHSNITMYEFDDVEPEAHEADRPAA